MFRCLLIAAALMLPAHAAERPPKVAPAPPPPAPATIKMKRGEIAEIPLRIYGTRGQTLTFLIRTAPAAGKLTTPKNVTDESAVVRYTPPADRAVTRDSFTYAVRSTEGVSAAAEVKIEIVDLPAQLIAPVELKNTNLLVGDTETLTLELTNQGDDVCEGDATVEAPWHIEPPAHYRVEGHGRAVLHVTFAPNVPGEFRADLHYSSQPDRLTTLSGTAVAALALRPAAVDLHLESITGARTGAFEIKNNTKTEQVITIHSSERLNLEPHLTLAPGASAAITIQTRPDDTDPLAEVIRFEARGLTAVLPVHDAVAPPAPPSPPVAAPASPPPIPAPPTATPPTSTPEPARPTTRKAPPRETPRNTPPEPEPEPEPAPRGPDPAAFTRTLASTPTSLTIDWPAGAPPADCHAETRDLALRDGKIAISWRRIGDVQIIAAGDRTRAVFTKLQPGQPYTMRVVAPIGESGSDEAVAQIDFITPTPPRHPPLFTWPRALGIALLILIPAAVTMRLRSRETGL